MAGVRPGDTNPHGPEIVLNGAVDGGTSGLGLEVRGSDCEVRGLVIQALSSIRRRD